MNSDPDAGAHGRLLEIMVERARGKKRLLVAIAGGPGSGKSTLLSRLEERARRSFPPYLFAFLPFDGFHFPNAYLDAHEHEGAPLRSIKGSPPTFDTAKAVSKLKELKSGGADVLFPAYSREIHDPVADALLVPAATRIVVVEGNYLLYDGPGYGEMPGLFDLKIYLHTDRETARRGVIARHVRGGRTPEDAERYFRAVDSGNFDLVEGTRSRADVIVIRTPGNRLHVAEHAPAASK
ncbi:MAG: nucleoside/nucleotide kinase family protein [bacterium]